MEFVRFSSTTGMLNKVFTPLVPKLSSADPLGSTTSFQEIRGYISVLATLKLTYFFN